MAGELRQCSWALDFGAPICQSVPCQFRPEFDRTLLKHEATHADESSMWQSVEVPNQGGKLGRGCE